MSKKYNGYIYVTLNQQTKKVYVGQKFGLPEKTEYYYGSGKYILRAIKKYGKQFFKKRVLGDLEADTKKELKILLNEAETECIYFYRSFGSDGINYDEIYGYNLTPIGGSTLGKKDSEETKIKKSIATSGGNNGMFNREQTKEAKGKQSIKAKESYANGRLGNMTGKRFFDVWVEKYGLEEANIREYERVRKQKETKEKNAKEGKITKRKGRNLTKEHIEKIKKSCENNNKGKNNPMFGKSVYSVWVEKYGKEEANKREHLRKEKTKITNENKKREVLK